MRPNYVKIKDVALTKKSINEQEDKYVSNALISKAMDGANAESWKDIRPAKNYSDIKKKGFIDQKRREFQEQRKNLNDQNADSAALPYKRQKMQKTTNSPVKGGIVESQADTEKDAFKLEILQKRQKMKQMSPEEIKEIKKLEKEVQLNKEMDQIINLIGKRGFQIFKQAVINYKNDKSVSAFSDSVILAFYNTYVEEPMSSKQLGDHFEEKRDQILKLKDHISKRDAYQFSSIITEFCESCQTLASNPIITEPDMTGMTIQQKLKALRQPKNLPTSEPEDNSEDYNGKLSTVLDDPDVKCCICYETSNIHISKCKHIACLDCWDTWLAKYLECPACRQRIRRNQIIRVRLPNQNK